MPTSSLSSSSPFTYSSMLDPTFTRPPGMRLVLPDYDRRQVRAGILHFGVGVFHRSHLACYVDQLLHCADTEPDCLNWGVCGVGIRPSARAAYEAFKAQDGLYSLIALGPDGDSTVRIVGSLVDFVFAPEQPTRLYRRLVHADTRCLSFTITEAAYRLSEADADTQRDLQRWPDFLNTISRLQSSAADDEAEDGDSNAECLPRSLFGWVVLGLEARRRAGLPPFTLLSCDNVSGNGAVLKGCLLSFARAVRDDALLSFIESSVSCPSSMVDRITALTGPDSIHRAKTEFGVIDRWPVLTEEWRQWCLQLRADASPPSFTAGSPPFHLLTADVSNHVQLVPDIRPYEAMKLRLLNSSHSLCCYLGCLSGHRYVHEYYSKPHFIAFARRFMETEVEPLMPAVPGVDLRQYERAVIARFGNSSIRDLTLRICQDGASKLPQRLVPTLQANPSCHCAPLAVAAWFAFLRGVDESGRAVPLQDPRAAELRLDEAAKARPDDAKAMLEAARPIFGQLSDNEQLRQRLQHALDMLRENGAEATVCHWLET